MSWLPLLLAAEEQPQMGTIEGFMKSPLPLVFVFFIVMMIFMSRTSARQRREQLALQNAVKRNSKVVTASGIIGIVVAIKEDEDEVTLRVDETTNSRIRVLKSSIARVISEEQQSAAPTENKTP
ncbi:MAG: preprotein translocase subunit YajC [Planctomycetes bacterium]|nr:preprotein translocase subunit YajC [Planctomycetota bacterium]